MYRAIGELLLDGVRYQPGQIVDMGGIDARTVTRLVEQRRILFASVTPDVPPPAPVAEPKRKAA